MVLKMSEKRFRVRFEQEDGKGEIVNEKGVELTAREVVDLLNEQQSTNSALRTENNHLIDVIKEYAKKYEEQQATIRKLQDLCGKSDGENMKLRIENKRLEKEVNLLRPTNIEQYEQIQKLQEENEQLQAQLREKEEDEQLYADEIVKLNKEAKEVLDFKSLGGDY